MNTLKMMNLEFLMMVFLLSGVALATNFSFLVSIIILLLSGVVLFFLMLVSNNLFFSLIVLLVYVGGMLLLFMYVCTMLSIFDGVMNMNYKYLLLFLILGDLLGIFFNKGLAYGVFSSYVVNYLVVSMGGVFLFFSLLFILVLLMNFSCL